MKQESLSPEIFLKLLIADEFFPDKAVLERGDLECRDWPSARDTALKNAVLIRSYERFQQLGFSPGEKSFHEGVLREKERVQKVMDLIKVITEIKLGAGLPFVFTKAFQHYPDMGHDIDLLVGDRSDKADILLKDRLGLRRLEDEGIFDRFAGKRAYWAGTDSTIVEIHHARMGQVGEFNRFPERLLSRRISYECGSLKTFIPCPEDQLMIQVLQRVYRHLYFRVSDILHTIRIVSSKDLNWDLVWRTAEHAGVTGGLIFYLRCVECVSMQCFNRSWLPPEVRTHWKGQKTNLLKIRGECYRFPFFPIIPGFFLKKLFREVACGNWESVRNLCLLPPLTAFFLTRKIFRAVWLK